MKISTTDEHIVLVDGVQSIQSLKPYFLPESSGVDYDFDSLKLRKTQSNAFVLRYALRGKKNVTISPETAQELKVLATAVRSPFADIDESDTSRLKITVPMSSIYVDSVIKSGAYYVRGIGAYRLILSEKMRIDAINQRLENLGLPSIVYSQNLKEATESPIEGFDGSVRSLTHIPVSVLSTVRHNVKTSKAKNKKVSLQESLQSMGIETLYDVVMNLPRRYINKSESVDFGEFVAGEEATVVGEIVGTRLMKNNKGITFIVKLGSEKEISASFFNQAWLSHVYKVGDEVVITGKVGFYNRQLTITGKSIDSIEEASVMGIVPIYSQKPSMNVTTAIILSLVHEMFLRLPEIKTPSYLGVDESGMNLNEALRSFHFPQSMEDFEKALDYLARAEVILTQIILTKQTQETFGAPSVVLDNDSLMRQAIEVLPFSLTNSQLKAIEKNASVVKEKMPHTILLNADVGTGKTVVLQMASLVAVGSGYQSIISSPAEGLALQLYRSMVSLNERMGSPLEIVYYSINLRAKEKREVLQKIQSGEANIIVGSKSVLSPEMKYSNLGFVVIDEQQKFGVEDRTNILKARQDRKIPHVMMTTATPQPRSTVQTLSGNAIMNIIDERPPGQTPVETIWVQESVDDVISGGLTHEIWEDIKNEAKQGHQTYVFAPVVRSQETYKNGVDKQDVASVDRIYEDLSNNVLSDLKIGVVHGQMKREIQDETLDAFRKGELDVIVSSTVLEVGIDVPTATRVVIFSPERLGMSSLHQIRGRVGRSTLSSRCYLVTSSESKNAVKRLQALVEHNDGFRLAEIDLETRGGGNLLSYEQKGDSGQNFATLSSHIRFTQEAHQEAQRILKSPFAMIALKDAQDYYHSDGERLI